VKERLSNCGAKMSDGFKTKHPSAVLGPVHCTTAHVANTPVVQGLHFPSHRIYNPVLGDKQSTVLRYQRQRNNFIYNGFANADNYNKT
jgi:hypothetical protein